MLFPGRRIYNQKANWRVGAECWTGNRLYRASFKICTPERCLLLAAFLESTCVGSAQRRNVVATRDPAPGIVEVAQVTVAILTVPFSRAIAR